MTTKPDSDSRWGKEFPQVEGFYFARRTQTNAPGLTIIQVWQYEDEWYAYRFANQNDIEAEDFIRSLYEYLGPLSPSDFEQLIRLRKVAALTLKMLDDADYGLDVYSLAPNLRSAAKALREALTHTGEQS